MVKAKEPDCPSARPAAHFFRPTYRLAYGMIGVNADTGPIPSAFRTGESGLDFASVEAVNVVPALAGNDSIERQRRSVAPGICGRTSLQGFPDSRQSPGSTDLIGKSFGPLR
jgi:hypothetical protein